MEQGGMTLAQCQAYAAKRRREHCEREALQRQLRQAVAVFDLHGYLDALCYLRRLVACVQTCTEAAIAEEQAQPGFRRTAFMRELVSEDSALWPEMLYGPYPLSPAVNKRKDP